MQEVETTGVREDVSAPTTEDVRIGQRIKERQQYLGLTQKELGERCNMRRSRISNYINASSRVPAPELGRIARALGVSCDHLINGQEFDVEERPYEVATKADIQQLRELLLKRA